MEKYIKALYDRLEDDKKGQLFFMMDSAINEATNSGALSQVSGSLADDIHSSDPEKRIEAKASVAKAVGYSFITASQPAPSQTGIAHIISILNNEKFPNSIAICVQGGLEGLYMSGVYKQNPSGTMDYHVLLDPNGQETTKLVKNLNLLNTMYDEINIIVVPMDEAKKKSEPAPKAKSPTPPAQTEPKKEKKGFFSKLFGK